VKVIIFDEEKKVIETFENIKSPVVDGNNVFWEDGSLGGINLPFLLLEDDIQVNELVTDEVMSQDKKTQFPKVDLKSRLEAAEMAIISLMDFM
jgi:hypothetical protein